MSREITGFLLILLTWAGGAVVASGNAVSPPG